jgi:hypothetical protein
MFSNMPASIPSSLNVVDARVELLHWEVSTMCLDYSTHLPTSPVLHVFLTKELNIDNGSRLLHCILQH